MERSLCFLVGKEAKKDGSNYIMLTAPMSNHKKLDAFTMNRFENSNEIREIYQGKIEYFLNQFAQFTNQKGSIVILEFHKNQVPIKKRVLYMTVKQKMEEILGNLSFLQWEAEKDELRQNNRVTMFSYMMIDCILLREGYTKSDLNEELQMWKKKALQEPLYGSDRIRILLKDYENWNDMMRKRCETEEEKKHFQNKTYHPSLEQRVKANLLKEELRQAIPNQSGQLSSQGKSR